MGCDIHLYKEKMVDGVWLTADEWETYDYGDDDKGQRVPYEKQFNNRNYKLFGALASGVRTEHDFSFEQRGLPLVMSYEVSQESEHWGIDGHSHSYLYLHELKEFAQFIKTKNINIEGMKDKKGLEELRASIASGDPDWSLLFPYCAFTNADNSEHFELEMPADFYFGDAITRIIESFDGIDGENHRIVFWFDN